LRRWIENLIRKFWFWRIRRTLREQAKQREIIERFWNEGKNGD
jgi:hypothetical protein